MIKYNVVLITRSFEYNQFQHNLYNNLSNYIQVRIKAFLIYKCSRSGNINAIVLHFVGLIIDMEGIVAENQTRWDKKYEK